MAIDVTSGVNSAIVSGMYGLQNASNDIVSAATNIANKSNSGADINDLLSGVATQQLTMTKDLLSGIGGDSVTDSLVSLQIGYNNAQASARVVDTANDTVGTIIDALA